LETNDELSSHQDLKLITRKVIYLAGRCHSFQNIWQTEVKTFSNKSAISVFPGFLTLLVTDNRGKLSHVEWQLMRTMMTCTN
jgi:hypothetical protein